MVGQDGHEGHNTDDATPSVVNGNSRGINVDRRGMYKASLGSKRQDGRGEKDKNGEKSTQKHHVAKKKDSDKVSSVEPELGDRAYQP